MKTPRFDEAIQKLQEARQILKNFEQELPGSVAEQTFDEIDEAIDFVKEDKRHMIEMSTVDHRRR